MQDKTSTVSKLQHRVEKRYLQGQIVPTTLEEDV